jgi:hypothetical protein
MIHRPSTMKVGTAAMIDSGDPFFTDGTIATMHPK